MPFSFSTIEPNQIGQVSKFDIPLNQWLGLKFTEGHSYTAGNAISEMTEDAIWDDDNPVGPDVLNRVYGIDGRLKFDSPMSIQRARLINERKRKELERLAYLESASHSWFSAKAAAGFGASLVGGLSHPLDFGLAFLPFIGSERAAAQVSRLGGNTFRQSLARGLITTEESLAARGVQFARLTAATIDGTLSQALLEIPVAIQKHRNMADYTLTDSVFNIAAGGAFAGAIKGIGLALERAGRLWLEADPRVREAVLMDTVNTIITGEQPKAHWAMGLDEATIRAKVDEEVRAREPFTEPEEPDVPRGTIEDPVSIARGLETIAQKEARGLPLTEKQKSRVESLIDPDNPRAYNEYQRRVSQIEKELDRPAITEAARKQAINDFNAKAKADYEQRIAEQVDTETKRVMDDVRKQVPAMPPETAKKNSFKSVPEDAQISALAEEIADIEASIMATARTPEDMIRLQKRMERLQSEADELSGEKAVDKMLPCVAKRAE